MKEGPDFTMCVLRGTEHCEVITDSGAGSLSLRENTPVTMTHNVTSVHDQLSDSHLQGNVEISASSLIYRSLVKSLSFSSLLIGSRYKP